MPPQVCKETKVTKNGVETKTSYPVQWAFVQIQQHDCYSSRIAWNVGKNSEQSTIDLLDQL